MAKKKKMSSFDFNNKLLEILQRLRYDIAQCKNNHGWFRPLASILLPTANALFSLYLLSLSHEFYYATIIGILYKVMVAFYLRDAYHNKFVEQNTTSWTPETPLVRRFYLLLGAIAMLGIVICTHGITRENITQLGVWMCSALLNIFFSWLFEMEDALVALYGADIPNPTPVAQNNRRLI